MKYKNQTEDQVKKSCTILLKSKGWIPKTIYTGGIPSGFGGLVTNPAKGIPDCIAFHPELRKTIWIEYKRTSGGILSEYQLHWHRLIRECSPLEVYVINSRQSLELILKGIHGTK